MADVTDKKRLRQIQKQDLTESRLNDDFVFWLKTRGMNWLLVLLVVACLYSFWNIWRQRQDRARDNAWSELAQATLPESFAEVAKNHQGTDSIALIAWLAAADTHLRDIQTGTDSSQIATPNLDGSLPPPTQLTAEGRKIAQDSAGSYYDKILEALGARRSEIAMKPLTLSALFGKAAIAESRGQMDVAKQALEEAQTIAGEDFPIFAKEAKVRLDTLPMLASAKGLPAKASLPVRESTTPVAPNVSDELIKGLTPAAAPAPAAATPIKLTPVDPANVPPGALGNTAPPKAPTTPPVTPPAAPK